MELNIKSSKELEKVLMKEDYHIKNYFSRHNFKGTEYQAYQESQKVNSIEGHINLLDNMIKQKNGSLPTQTEFVEAGLIIAKAWWDGNKKHLSWNGALIGFRYRLAETYCSRVNEFHTVLKLKELFPEARICTDDTLDYGLGVDIVVKDYPSNMIFYIHVLKDSDKAMFYYNKKKNKDGFVKNKRTGDRVFFKKRDFSNHINFQFKTSDTKVCEVFGGMALFTDNYLLDKIEEARILGTGDNMDGHSRLDEFRAFCVANDAFSY